MVEVKNLHTKMSKKEGISRLEFWIEVLKSEKSPDEFEWEDFMDLIKLSAQDRLNRD